MCMLGLGDKKAGGDFSGGSGVICAYVCAYVFVFLLHFLFMSLLFILYLEAFVLLFL